MAEEETLDRRDKRKKTSKYGMYDDIEEIAFGFGDAWPPDSASVELLELMAVNFIQDLCARSMQVASITGKLDKECFLFQVRRDHRKFCRATRLLKANEELKRAQKYEMEEK